MLVLYAGYDLNVGSGYGGSGSSYSRAGALCLRGGDRAGVDNLERLGEYYMQIDFAWWSLYIPDLSTQNSRFLAHRRRFATFSVKTEEL